MTDKIEAPFEREMRYFVLKIKDVQKYLDDEEFYQLRRICDAVAVGRARDGRPELVSVVVESDWPEYEAVWAMIEARFSGNPSALLREAAHPERHKWENLRKELSLAVTNARELFHAEGSMFHEGRRVAYEQCLQWIDAAMRKENSND